jgi:hypothetical protein
MKRMPRLGQSPRQGMSNEVIRNPFDRFAERHDLFPKQNAVGNNEQRARLANPKRSSGIPTIRFQGCRAAPHDDHIHIQIR